MRAASRFKAVICITFTAQSKLSNLSQSQSPSLVSELLEDRVRLASSWIIDRTRLVNCGPHEKKTLSRWSKLQIFKLRLSRSSVKVRNGKIWIELREPRRRAGCNCRARARSNFSWREKKGKTFFSNFRIFWPKSQTYTFSKNSWLSRSSVRMITNSLRLSRDFFRSS